MTNQRIRQIQRSNSLKPADQGGTRQLPRFHSAKLQGSQSGEYKQERESARRRRQIERGSLTKANGLV